MENRKRTRKNELNRLFVVVTDLLHFLSAAQCQGGDKILMAIEQRT